MFFLILFQIDAFNENLIVINWKIFLLIWIVLLNRGLENLKIGRENCSIIT